MSFLKRLFGGGRDEAGTGDAAGEPLEYKGFSIRATPFKADGQYQCCGVISKEIGGETKEHRFIRADKFSSIDDAVPVTLRKGQQIVDEQGERMFE
jgi:hypothetical protein